MLLQVLIVCQVSEIFMLVHMTLTSHSPPTGGQAPRGQRPCLFCSTPHPPAPVRVSCIHQVFLKYMFNKQVQKQNILKTEKV